MKPKIIGLTGKKGVGKNFVADIAQRLLNDHGMSVSGGAFADELKKFCINVLGLEHKQCYGSDAEKNTPTNYSWENVSEWIRERNPWKSGMMTAREVMQIFGTEIIRDTFGKDVWIKATYRKIAESHVDYYFITDVRFPNEAENIKEWGGTIWLIDGPQRGEECAKKDGHPSEVETDKVIADVSIINDLQTDEDSLARRIAAHLQFGLDATS